MRALSLTQPWGSLAIGGKKAIETRDWASRGYTGPMAIHAAKNFPEGAMDLCDESPFREALAELGFVARFPESAATQLPRGVILGTVELTGCVKITRAAQVPLQGSRELAFGNFTPGRYMWLLADPQQLVEPIPARGLPGLWEWDLPETSRLVMRS